ncbi:MAG: hypothetical protein CMP56_02670 [Flavobacteriales bacterium]|nr:hypothetical protein [Flavobacteriales bacterium]|tara:strand:- start:157 stop:510 length:354 start_codon:yes stop_codon:yes gene_type:complete
MKQTKFIKKSIYPGGTKALKDFIKNNLTYPNEAKKQGIQGDVIVKFKVESNGNVSSPKIINGIGYGCDEEAIRIVKKLKYPKSINRKIRVTTYKKLKIKFQLPKQTQQIKIKYRIVK